MPPTLLNLPRELRNMIYRKLWEITPLISLRADDGEFPFASAGLTQEHHQRGILENHWNTPYGLPPWLWACKQILHEAQTEFNLTGRWKLERTEDQFEYVRMPLIFPIFEARFIHLCAESSEQDKGIYKEAGLSHRIDVPYLRSISELVRRLKLEGCVTELAVSIDLFYLSSNPQEPANFERLAKALCGLELEKLHLHVKGYIEQDVPLEVKSRLWSALATTLTAVGQVALGTTSLQVTENVQDRSSENAYETRVLSMSTTSIDSTSQ
ncbi:hypothetical protein T440DRAFT_242452 [Plenodomus tracheiphilus IPT5]|uniref:Uncharacterized protein n=1 Tax=Plenodomus tracheiphilus IPT5 TaxID=1408161 RepID=A0A6A7BKV5_9PLEO|nr:hypothetical protein T440DRAFT_242452 [Plenodomus tracheiphilus IPT5]